MALTIAATSFWFKARAETDALAERSKEQAADKSKMLQRVYALETVIEQFKSGRNERQLYDVLNDKLDVEVKPKELT
jgi:hypothetical protein